MARMRNIGGVRGSHGGQVARVGGSVRLRRSSLLRSTALQASFAVVLLFPASGRAEPAANARPQGGSVVAGSAAIVNSASLTAVNQSSQRAAINWTSFDLGSQQAVQFNQPSTSAITLNRVTGPDPSRIAGRITANGTIVLTNQSGVVFSQGAQVNAQTLLVTTADISNQNFMAGRLVFDTAGKPNAMIVNAGTISVAQSGLAALVAPAVANSGTITARMGTVVLAGAATHTVDLYGDGLLAIDVTRQVGQAPVGADGQPVRALVTNTGVIRADGGTVLLTAAAVDGIVGTLVNAGGKISADTVGGRVGTVVLHGVGGSLTIEGEVGAAGVAAGTRGGAVEINATNAVTLAATARVSASGAAGGGTVAVGTTLARAAGGPTVTPALTAKNVTVARGAKVEASAMTAGDGGRVTVLSTERTDMAGSIVARGGPAGGNGGFVEVSGKTGYSLTGDIDVSAALGRQGSILIDPTDLTIVGPGAGADDGIVGPTGVTVVSGGTIASVSSDKITALTGNVTVEAAHDLTVAAGADMTVSSADLLILRAGNNVTVNSPIAFASGNGDLVLTAAASGAGFNPPTTGALSITAALTTGTGTLTLNAGAGGISTTAAGILTATKLTGSATGAVALGAVNQVSTLGAFGVTGANFGMTNARALVIAGTVSGNNIRLIDTAAGGIRFGDGTTAGKLSVAGSGTIGLRADVFATTGNLATNGTLSAPGGVIEIVPNSVANIGLETASTATVLGFAPSTFTMNVATLRLGANGGVVGSSAIDVTGATNLSARAATLDLQTTGAVTQASALTVSTLKGTASSITLGAAGNSIANLDNLAATAAGISITDSAAITVLGTATLSGTSITITDSFKSTATPAITMAGTLSSAGTIRLSATDTTAAGTTGIALSGVIGTAPIATTTTVLDLTSGSADVVQSGGSIVATQLLSSTGAKGAVTLNRTTNAINTLAAFSTQGGDFQLTDSVALNVSAVASATGNLRLTDTNANGITIAAAGGLSVAGAGTISLKADQVASGNATAALSSVGGVIEVASNTASVQLSLGVASTGVVLGFDPGAYTMSAATLRLGSVAGTRGSSPIFIAATTDLTVANHGAATLDLQTTAAVTERNNRRLTVDTLTGSAGSIALPEANTITTVRDLTTTTGALSLTDAAGLTTAGTVSGFTDLTLTDTAAPAGTPALIIGGTLGAAGVIQLNATTAAATPGVVGISLGGTVGALPAVSTTTTLDLVTAGSSVSQGAGKIIAAKVLSSGGITGDVTLQQAANAIASIGDTSIGSGTLQLTSSTPLTVSGTVVTTTAAKNISLTDSAVSSSGTAALTVSGSLTSGAGGKVILNATDNTISASDAIVLTGRLSSTTGTIDLSAAKANITQSGGTIEASVLTSTSGAGGLATLNSTANAITTLGAFTVSGGDFQLTDRLALSVGGAVSASANLRLVDTNSTGITIGGAFGLAVTGAGTISLMTDQLASGASTAGLTTVNGMVELATNTAARQISLGVASSGLVLGFDPAAYAMSATTLRLGSFAGTRGSSPIAIVAPTDLTLASHGAPTLDLQTTGAVSQGVGFTLKVGTLSGSAGTLTLSEANNIGTLSNLATTAGALSVTDAIALATAGTITSPGDITLTDSFASTATPALTIGGTLGAPGVIKLVAPTPAAIAGAVGINIAGTIGTTPVATSTTTIDLNTGGSTINESASGVLIARRIISSTGINGNVTLSPASPGANAVAQLGNITVTGGTLSLGDSAGLTVVSGATVKADNVTLIDSFASTGGGSPVAAITVAGQLRVTSNGTVTVNASDTTSAGNTGINITGTLGNAGATIDLVSGSANIAESASGVVSAAVLKSTTNINGAGNLSAGTNTIDTLGDLTVINNDFTLTDTIPLVINGTVVTTTAGKSIRIVDTALGGVTLGDAGHAGVLLVTGGGTISVQADQIIRGASGGSFTASSGVVEVATNAAGRVISLGVASTAGLLGFDPAQFALDAATLRVGSINGSVGSSPVSIGGATNLRTANLASPNTLDLQTTGAVTQAAGAALTVARLTGTIGSLALGDAGNAITTINDLIADGGVGLVNDVALTVQGVAGIVAGRRGIVPGATLSLRNTGDLALNGPIGNGGTGGVGISTVGAGNITVANGGTAVISSGGTLSIGSVGSYTQNGGLVNAPVVSISSTTGLNLTGGIVAASRSIVVAGSTIDSGLAPSIAMGGSGAFHQTGGTISAAGPGARVTLTPGSFTQSAGLIASDGAITIGAGSGVAGNLGSLASGVSGLTQSGGVIAAAGDINLWSTTTIAQSVGTIAAGGTIGATASNTLSQGNTGLTSATTVVAVLSGSGVRLHSLTADTAQGGDGMVDATRGAGADPLLYPVRIQAPLGTNSFSNFGAAASVTAGGGTVVFCAICTINGPVASFTVPPTPSIPVASVGATGAVLPDVVLLGDIVAPMSSGVAARNLALYSRHDTTGQVAASLLTGRAGVLTQDGAGNASPYPLPDLVRTVETAGFWSTAAAVIGNVTLTGSAVANLGTVTVAGVTGFGYGATGSFSLGNTAPGGTLTVMAGGPAGSAVYPGVAAWGGNLSISEAGRIVADGPVSSSGTLSLGAGGDLLVSGSAVLGAGSTVRLTTAGTYLQDSGLVDAPTITLASTLASGTGISVSGGTIAAPGLLQVTSVAGISQSGGVLASDNTLTIGSGSGVAGTTSGVATAGTTSSITQTGGTIAAVGNLTLFTTGALTQTAGVIAAGGTLAATASGDIVQGTPSLTSATTTVATMTGPTVNLFSTGGSARQGGDGIVAANQSVSVDPGTYLLKVQSPLGVNSFSIFGSPASVTAGSVAFNPAADVSATASFKPLTSYSPASAGAIGRAAASLPDVALLGDSIAFQTTGIAARNLALYSRHTTQGLVNATLLTGRAGVLTSDTAAAPDFVVPAMVRAVETAGFWSTAANITDGNFFLPNSVTNGSTVTVSAIRNLGTTVAGVNYGIGTTGSFNLDNAAPGGTLTVASGLMAWTGGVRINQAGATDTMLITSDINVASPAPGGIATAGTTMVPGVLTLIGNSITLGRSGAGVTLQASNMEFTGRNAVKVLDGVTIDTAGDTFTRPVPGVAPKDPQKLNAPPVHMPGALFTVGSGGFTQSGTFTLQPYTPTAYKLSGASYTPATHPVLEIVLSAQAGTVAFDPAVTLGLAAPKAALILDIGAGNVTGHIDADTLALFYTQQTGLPSTLFGTLRTAQGVAVTDQAAASQAFIAQNVVFVPSNHFQINGCALSSVNCILTSLFPQGIITNPFRDLFIGPFADQLDDPDLLLPNVSDRDY